MNVPRLKGVHYAIESGRLAAEAAFRALRRGEVASRVGALDSYDASLRASKHWKELYEVRNMRQAFEQGLLRRRRARERDDRDEGPLPPNGRRPTHPNAAAPLLRTGRASAIRRPTASYLFDKLSSVFASGNRTRDDQPNHIQVAHDVPPAGGGGVDVDVPGARLRDRRRRRATGRSTVQLTPSNCVQCGAISAKGGRLTPPEGGSGPEYTLT